MRIYYYTIVTKNQDGYLLTESGKTEENSIVAVNDTEAIRRFIRTIRLIDPFKDRSVFQMRLYFWSDGLDSKNGFPDLICKVNI